MFSAKPPFALLETIDTGPITNHVNIVRNAKGQFAYVTVGGLNEVKVFRTDDYGLVATIPVGKLPHGIWPSGDGSRIYVGLENDDAMTAIETLTNKVIATVPIGQAPQAVTYVPGAVPQGDGLQELVPLGTAGDTAHLTLVPPKAATSAAAPTSVPLFNQGLTQILEASVTGLAPKQPYFLALSREKGGGGPLEPLAGFVTNPAGAAIVNAVGPIRQIVRGEEKTPRRYLTIVSGTPDKAGPPRRCRRIEERTVMACIRSDRSRTSLGERLTAWQLVQRVERRIRPRLVGGDCPHTTAMDRSTRRDHRAAWSRAKARFR